MSAEPTIDEILASDKLSVSACRKIILSQQKQIVELQHSIAELQKLVEKLSKERGKNPTERLDESYSLAAEAKRKQREKEQRQKEAKAKKQKKANRKNKKDKKARMTTAEKVKLATRTETVYPTDRSPKECSFSHHRVAWRLEDGKAVLVAYKIYRFRKEFGKPAGLVGRSEYGIEIMIALAYQVYVVGLSIDKACQTLNFFQQLKLRKSQADALLNRLAREWENEFENLCSLLANSAVVHCDETSWSINSVWAFLNEKLTVLFYGVHKDGATLQQILDKNKFDGTLVSDNAAVYRGFTKSQKCWAHLIRKAIKLTLVDSGNASYRKMVDDLLSIYRDAKKVAGDGRLSDAGRASRVDDLYDRVVGACVGGWTNEKVGGTEAVDDYHRLCNEIMKLMVDRELFLFVTEAEVEGTNNASERQLRPDALARKTGRTNKTPRGARRQSIISSVLQSIGKQLDVFQLQTVIDEVKRWTAVGQSCFETMLGDVSSEQNVSKKGILDKVVLNADPR